jgi:hypothetical protein
MQQTNTDGVFHEVADKQTEQLETKVDRIVDYPVNERIMTPKLRRLINQKDAKSVLKDEVIESLLRLKAAKFGRALEDIAPLYPNSFFLPDKSKYEPKVEIDETEEFKLESTPKHKRSRTTD